MTNVAIDAMGGDAGLSVTIPAALQAVTDNPDLKITLFGDENKIKQHLKQYANSQQANIEIVHASQEISMGESPVSALRNKKDSSMRLAIQAVKSGNADVCISAGNTGALMGLSKLILRTLPKIERPVMMTAMPTRSDDKLYLLDVGANVNVNANQLHQFAVLANIALDKKLLNRKPRIGLLNVGHEEIKGTPVVKEADKLLSENTTINYIGYVEADQLFSGIADVIVCDGFVGNNVLKACEGSSRFIFSEMKKTVKKYKSSILWGFLLKKYIVNSINEKLNPSKHNGALFLGLNGHVVKSHGGADIAGFYHAIKTAMLSVKHNSVNIDLEMPELATE